MTDSILPYPINNNSSFTIKVPKFSPHIVVIAIRWLQKLDIDSCTDGGVIEFSGDNGSTWQNIFYTPQIRNPNVYNVFGYQAANVDSLFNNQIGFTGQDSTWKDTWLCFSASWVATIDTLLLRYSFFSDGINNNKEGWIIDNLNIHHSPCRP